MADFNKNLWAPWRMEYIRSMEQEEADEGCFLCHYAAHPEQDRTNHVLWRGEHCLAMLNRFPYTNGHLMIAVARHVGDPGELSPEEVTEMAQMSYAAVEVLARVVSAQGFNIGTNIGRCAGAGLPDHIHTHVVPRWSGDTNYMAVLGGTRVIPDGLNETFDQLVEAAVEMGLRSR